MLSFIDLFAGIGGFRRGFERAGGRCVFSCEIDKFSRKTYLANFPTDHPFFGGGVIEIALARQGVRVHAYDAMKPLINFWQWVKDDAELLASTVEAVGWVERDDYYQHRNELRENPCEDVASASLFFVLNRISFGGIFASGYSYHAVKRDDVPRGAGKIRDFHFPNTLSLELQDFEATLERHPYDFLYCDPPYINAKTSLYGLRGELHKDFKHQRLCEALLKRDRWVLSYGDCSEVREMYRKKRMIEMTWSYGKNGKKGKELLIFGDGVAIDDELPLFASNGVLLKL